MISFVAYLGFAFTRNIALIAVLFVGYRLYQGIFRSVGKALATDFVPDRLGERDWLVAGQLWDHVSHAAAFVYGAVFAIIGSIALLMLLPAQQIRRNA